MSRSQDMLVGEVVQRKKQSMEKENNSTEWICLN